MALRHFDQNSVIVADPAVTPCAPSVTLPLDAGVLHLLDQSEDCMKILSMDGRLEFMNCNGQKAMQIHNFSEFQGRVWWEFWPEESRPLVRKSFNRAAGGSEAAFEADCPTAMGECKRWSVELSAMLTSVGMPVGVLCKSRDITDRLRILA